MKKIIWLPFLLILLIIGVIIIIGVVKHYDYPEITPPEGYVVIENSYNFDFKVWSPENITIGINEQENTDEAPIEFWVNYLKFDFTQLKHYKFVEEVKFKPEISENGVCLIFEKKLNEVDYLYFIGIARTDDYVYVIEAAGEKETMLKDKQKLLKSFDTLN